MEKELNHIIVQCMRPNCQFRYPTYNTEIHTSCPKCGGPTKTVAFQRVENKPTAVFDPKVQRIEILLDNIRSAYNTGSILRTADAAGVSHIHFAGTTPTPDQSKVKKTSLGAEFFTPWMQHWNALKVTHELKEKGCQIISLELTNKSEPIFEIDPNTLHFPILLVLGNEVTGVDPEILQISDKVVEIPMMGEKSSLNVATAFGVAIYFLRHLAMQKKF